ncbi:MAG: phosphate acyltransferase PlsX [Rickettsiales bacterium]|nr:phosphate acyltransferase PlsX [Rickettsiales bacterium]
MSNINNITISLDCAGGDNYPGAMVGGMAKFIKQNKNIDIDFLLFGNKESISKELKKYDIDKKFYEIIHTDKKISSEDKPSSALRKGKDSSMWLALESVKLKKSNACISAGNTGALMVLSKFILRPLEGVDRPALIQLMPAKNDSSVALLDMGANIDCNSENLYQFALMGSIFYTSIMGKENPRIGLLNVGSEDLKGNESVKNAAAELKNSVLSDNFYGFVEGNDIFRNVVDVVVTDGFTGNIALKTIEGTVKFMAQNIKDLFKKSILSMFGLVFLLLPLKKFKQKINPDNYNGALFIGLNGISVKAHGNSNAKSFCCAIENTIKLINGDINNKIIGLLSEIENTGE